MMAAAIDTSLLTVPGNLLLLGEYAVLEEGGLGIAVALERRLVVRAEPADELTIVGSRGGFSETWRRSDRGPPGLPSAIVGAVERELGAQGLEGKRPPLLLYVDSSAFFDSDGNKIGLGSSAAVAVGIAQVLLRYSGIEGRALADSTFSAALGGHRAYQGGHGSGYDIAASLYGGYGLFKGGEKPTFERLALPWMRPFALLRGETSVDTTHAIERYGEWKRRYPSAAKAFFEASNEVVHTFAAAGTWMEASNRLKEGSRLGIELGAAIGVNARIARLEGRIGKALGAGDELGALWREDSETLAGELEEIEVAATGPRWRE